MNRNKAAQLTRTELDKYGLSDWGVGLSNNPNESWLGICLHNDKKILINAFHVDIHPDAEVICTIKHEVAHAVVGPGHGHDDVWAAKAREIGCDNTLPCSHLDLPAHVIDAIRSGNIVEMTVEEETHVIRRPKYNVTRLQDKCPDCGKIAKELFNFETIDKNTGDTIKLITLECFHIIKKVIPRGTPFETLVSNSWKPEVANCQHDWNKNKCNKCGEFRLFQFQVVGAQLIEQGLATQKGFGVFDDMGLGKTVQGLAYLKFHKEASPTLYVVKSAIKFNWFKEIIRWLGPDYLAQVISTSRDYVMPGLKSYIIAYDLLKRFDKTKFDKIGFKTVVMDECQQIKNPDSTRTQELRKLINNPTIKVIALSGTPWKNRGNEFFPVLNMIDPVKFYSYQHFLDTWVDYYYKGSTKKLGGIRNVAKFKEYTSNLLVRREYNEVMDEYPDINRMKLPVQLDSISQSSYDDETSNFVKWYNEHVISGTEENLNGMEILAKLTRMRHITGLAKIPATLGFIEQFVEDTDRKIVVFVHHKDVAQLLISALTNTDKKSNADWYDLAQTIKDEGIRIVKLTAEYSDEERYNIAENFNKTGRVIMIASTLASGEGINLQTCWDSILHERQWNPQNEEQATPGRFRRIGQTSGVINITVPEAEGTVDEFLDSIIEEKRLRFHDVMNKGQVVTWNQGDIGKALAEMIVNKHRERMKSQGKEIKPTNITQMASY